MTRPHKLVVRVDSSQEATRLVPVRRCTHLQQGIDLVLHWLARGRCHFVSKEVSLFDSPIALERIGLQIAICYLLQDLVH